MMRSIAILTMIFIFTVNITAQQSPLNRELTLHVPGILVKDALLLIGEETSMNFSYNSALIDGHKTVSINAENASMENVLNEIIQEDIQYKVVGNHIVLLAANNTKTKNREIEKTGYAISGYIYDSSTGKVIRSATIYDVDGERTSITDNEGFYSILIPSNNDFRGLTYCKEGYLDTVIIIRPAENITLDMQLNPEVRPLSIDPVHIITLAENSFEQHRFVDKVVPAEALSHSNNLVLYDRRIGQVSFLPLPGTHTSRNGVMINRFSLNIIAGYNGGVEGVEIGAMLNVDRNYVKGLQIAGFGNVVGKKTTGIQIAGFSNINIGSISGFQIAGFNNVVNDTINGVQIAGFTNYIRGSMTGFQVAGFYNHLGRSGNGIQAAGFVNVGIDTIIGAQVAGFTNFQFRQTNGFQVAGFNNHTNGKVNGGQVAGGLNTVGNGVDGIQVVGLANVSIDTVRGIQVAGLLNIAGRKMTGVQVSLFNSAREMNGLQVGLVNTSINSKAYSIGLFNYVWNGYRAIDMSVDEVFYANLAFKTGNKKLYNIYNIGVQPFNNTWSVGFGFGNTISLGKKLNIFNEVTTSTVNEGISIWRDYNLNLLNRYNLGVDYHFSEKLALFAAGTFNVHVLKSDSQTNEFTTDIAFHPFYEKTNGNVRTQMWIGAKVGLRLVLNQ